MRVEDRRLADMHPITNPSPETDQRPALAIGHLFLATSDVAAASARLERVGVRPIMVQAK